MPKKKREIPWLEWRGGVAYVFWYNAERRIVERLSLRTEDPEQAQRRYAAFLLEGREVFAPAAANAGLTVWRALEDYEKEHVQAVDDKGRPLVADQRRQTDIIAHLKAFFPVGKLVKDISIEDCDDPATGLGYLQMRRAGKIGGRSRRKSIIPGKDGTVRRELVTLTAAIEHAAKRKRIKRDDIPFIKKPGDSDAKDDYLTLDQLAAVRAKAEGELLDWIDITYSIAARRRATERMTIFQVDLEHGRVRQAKDGERATKKRRPIVPIYPDVRPIYERLVKKAKEDKRTRLFVLTDFYRPFVKACVAAGITRHVSPHILRHSRITHMLQRGDDIWDVAKLSGDSVKTIEKTYGHHCAEHLARLEADKAPTKIEDMLS